MYIHTNEVTKDTFAHTSVSQLITEKKCPSLCDFINAGVHAGTSEAGNLAELESGLLGTGRNLK